MKLTVKQLKTLIRESVEEVMGGAGPHALFIGGLDYENLVGVFSTKAAAQDALDAAGGSIGTGGENMFAVIKPVKMDPSVEEMAGHLEGESFGVGAAKRMRMHSSR